MLLARLALVLMSCSMLSACGAVDSLRTTVACDFREGSALTDPEPRCQERVDTIEGEGFKLTCESVGKPLDGGCPREGAVVGCFMGKQGDGSEVVDWYYPPKTREEVAAEDCEDPEDLRDP